jgi:translation initiation factor IF-3
MQNDWKRNPDDSEINQKYYIQNGKHTICKVMVYGKWLYELWTSGKFVKRGSDLDKIKEGLK